MKKRLLFFAFASFCFLPGRAQQAIEVTANYFLPYPMNIWNSFEAASDSGYMVRDTSAGNIWQMGHPQKTGFTAAITGSRAIVTDTLNTYPVSNTSSFTMKIINYDVCLGTTIQFNYEIQSTAGQDGGMIEVSHDNGLSWANVISDPYLNPGPLLYSQPVAALGNQPGLSGDSTLPAFSNISMWFNPYHFSPGNDTIMLRFTFASDSIPENLDGWMLDDLYIWAACENIPEYGADPSLEVFPNPSTGKVFLKSEKADRFDASLYDAYGRLLRHSQTSSELDYADLPEGCYFLELRSGDLLTRKKLILQH